MMPKRFYILAVLLTLLPQTGWAAKVVRMDGASQECEQVTLHQNLQVYKDPSLFRQNPEESPLLGTFIGQVSIQRLGEPVEFNNLIFFSSRHPIAEGDSNSGVDNRIIPVRMCDSAYKDTLGFIVESDLTMAQKEVRKRGYLPPSVYPNPIPKLED